MFYSILTNNCLSLFVYVINCIMETTIKDYFTVKELADRAGVTPKTINEWRKNDIIKSCKIGGRRYFHKFDVHKLLNAM